MVFEEKTWVCNHVNGTDDPMTGENLEERAKEYLLSIGVKEESLDYFYISGTERARYYREGATHLAIENLINDEGFEILHLYRDHGHDDCDDAGWIVSISKKNDKYYLHILMTSYNYELKTIVLDEESLALCGEGAFGDFFAYDSVEKCQAKLNELRDHMITLKEHNEDMEYYQRDEIPIEGLSTYEKDCLVFMCFGDREYSQGHDEYYLPHLSEFPYVRNTTDKWIKPVCNGKLLEDIDEVKMEAYFEVHGRDVSEDTHVNLNMYAGFVIAEFNDVAPAVLKVVNTRGAKMRDLIDAIDKSIHYFCFPGFVNLTASTKERVNMLLT